MIQIARDAGKTVLIDPKGSDYDRYKGASIITPNRAELAEVTGHWKSEEDLTERRRTCASISGFRPSFSRGVRKA